MLLQISHDRLKSSQGNTVIFDLICKDEDNEIFDLTGFHFYFKANLPGVATSIAKDFECTFEPTNGVIPVTLPSDITAVPFGDLDYEGIIKDTSTPPIVYTVAKGVYELEDSLHD